VTLVIISIFDGYYTKELRVHILEKHMSMTMCGKTMAKHNLVFDFFHVLKNVRIDEIFLIFLDSHFSTKAINFKRVAPLAGAPDVDGLHPVGYECLDIREVAFFWGENKKILKN